MPLDQDAEQIDRPPANRHRNQNTALVPPEPAAIAALQALP